MKKGISIYPGLDNTPEENIALIQAAARLGITRIFTSLQIPETSKESFAKQLQELLQDAWLLTAQALLLQAGKPKDGTLPEEAELLSRSLSSRRLEGLSALLRQYSAECAYNVGAGHVLGALCAQWERLLHATR